MDVATKSCAGHLLPASTSRKSGMRAAAAVAGMWANSAGSQLSKPAALAEARRNAPRAAPTIKGGKGCSSIRVRYCEYLVANPNAVSTGSPLPAKTSCHL
eukprot:4479705-Alexandrium_andersonii.AAC.1